MRIDDTLGRNGEDLICNDIRNVVENTFAELNANPVRVRHIDDSFCEKIIARITFKHFLLEANI